MSSPCIDVCRYDEEQGWCLGCGMTKAEKKAWKRDRDAREGIKGQLPARLAIMAGLGRIIGKAAKHRKARQHHADNV